MIQITATLSRLKISDNPSLLPNKCIAMCMSVSSSAQSITAESIKATGRKNIHRPLHTATDTAKMFPQKHPRENGHP